MDTTTTLWGIIEDELPLDNCKKILFEISDEHEDGTYPLVMHYVTLANKIDDEGTSAWLNRMAGKKSKRLDFLFYDGIRIIRECEYDAEAVVIFKNPISIVMGYVGEQPIIAKVTQLKGEFFHDWFWTKEKRQNKIANGFEIYFRINELIV